MTPATEKFFTTGFGAMQKAVHSELAKRAALSHVKSKEPKAQVIANEVLSYMVIAEENGIDLASEIISSYNAIRRSKE